MAVPTAVIWRSMHVSEQKFNIRTSKTMRRDESYRLVTTVPVINSQCSKIHNVVTHHNSSIGIRLMSSIGRHIDLIKRICTRDVHRG